LRQVTEHVACELLFGYLAQKGGMLSKFRLGSGSLIVGIQEEELQ